MSVRDQRERNAFFVLLASKFLRLKIMLRRRPAFFLDGDWVVGKVRELAEVVADAVEFDDLRHGFQN